MIDIAKEPAPMEVVLAEHIKRILSAASGTSRESVEKLCAAIEALYYSIPSEFRDGIPDPLAELARITDGRETLVENPMALRQAALKIFSQIVDSLHQAGIVFPIRKIVRGYEEE